MSVRRAALVISPPVAATAPPLRLVGVTDSAPASHSRPRQPTFATRQRDSFGGQTVAADTPTEEPQRDFSLDTSRGRLLKRLLDLALSVPVVLLALPVLCFVVKAVQWFQSSGPLFYCQKRCGRGGREFTILKFRTMDLPPAGRTDIEENPGARIYPLGKILRRSKLDEIPQFINVLLGSMSVVGPRPHHFDDCEKFAQVVGDYALRTVTKPGITGLAQYTEYRGDFEWNCVENRVAKDLIYIHNWSIVLDLLLICKTAAIVCRAVVGGVSRRLGVSDRRHSPASTTLTIYALDQTDADTAGDRNAGTLQGNETRRRAA